MATTVASRLHGTGVFLSLQYAGGPIREEEEPNSGSASSSCDSQTAATTTTMAAVNTAGAAAAADLTDRIQFQMTLHEEDEENLDEKDQDTSV